MSRNNGPTMGTVSVRLRAPQAPTITERLAAQRLRLLAGEAVRRVMTLVTPSELEAALEAGLRVSQGTREG